MIVFINEVETFAAMVETEGRCPAASISFLLNFR